MIRKTLLRWRVSRVLPALVLLVLLADSASGQMLATRRVPEIDASLIGRALTLVFGGVLLLTQRIRRARR
ncbi:MAG: hypothetical protein AAF682_06585 [Planctomycetota bacterium]